MPSVSKKQQNFFRLVRLVKDGKIKKSEVSDSIVKAADGMSKKDISDFADHLKKKKKRKKKVNESYLEDVYYDTGYDIYNLLSEFFEDKENGVKTIQFNLIPKNQYINLIKRYMNIPDAFRIPDKIVDEWLEMIAINVWKLYYITELAGHASNWPSEDLSDFFENFEDAKNIDWMDYDESYEYLEKIGFYDWCKLPDGSDAWSDYGLEPIYKIFEEYKENMSGAEKLLLINRILDVTHHRGDLASAFIEGGSRTCSEVSGVLENFNKKQNHILMFEEFCKINK